MTITVVSAPSAKLDIILNGQTIDSLQEVFARKGGSTNEDIAQAYAGIIEQEQTLPLSAQQRDQVFFAINALDYQK